VPSHSVSVEVDPDFVSKETHTKVPIFESITGEAFVKAAELSKECRRAARVCCRELVEAPNSCAHAESSIEVVVVHAHLAERGDCWRDDAWADEYTWPIALVPMGVEVARHKVLRRHHVVVEKEHDIAVRRS
jgi:hypothetical protein